MLHRAHSTLEIKSIDEDRRIISGIASTPSVDSQFDIVEPMGAQFKLPLPLLWQHDAYQPVGEVTRAVASEDGITVVAEFRKVDAPPSLKDDLDRAWAMVRERLVRGLSIGFRSLESEPIRGGGRRHIRWDWVELSAVTMPANADAQIATVKAHDKHASPLLAQATTRATSRREFTVSFASQDTAGDSEYRDQIRAAMSMDLSAKDREFGFGWGEKIRATAIAELAAEYREKKMRATLIQELGKVIVGMRKASIETVSEVADAQDRMEQRLAAMERRVYGS